MTFSVPPDLVRETISFVEDLVRMNSYTRNPEGVEKNAERILSQFEPFGFKQHRIACREANTGQHLILDSGNEGPCVAMIGHLDTVYPPEEEIANDFHWKVEGSRATGPGVFDMKGGTGLMWLTLALIKHHQPELFAQTRWILVWNAAEEILAPDFTEVCLQLLPAGTKACLVFEPDGGSDDHFAILTERKGMAKFRIQTKGLGGHAGNGHHKGVNAVHQLARLVDKLQNFTDYKRDLTVNVGRFEGGVLANRVPEEALALVETRCFDPKLFNETRDRIKSLQGKGDVVSAVNGTPCQIEVVEELVVRPWPENSRTLHLRDLWKQSASILELNLTNNRRGGVSDGNHLADRFPTLDGMGPRGGNAHISGTEGDGCEFLDLSSFEPKARINALAIQTLLRT